MDMKQTDYKWYIAIQKGKVPLSSVPKTVRDSIHFMNLLEAGIIDKEKSGRGSNVIVKKPKAYAEFLSTHFPDASNDTKTKSANIRKFRNSKARRKKTPSIFLVRGFKPVQINSKNLDLKTTTELFGLFAVSNIELVTEKVCFVENLDTFLKAEKILGEHFIYLHKYGRIGKESIKGISANDIVVFVDYDFNGLDEFLRIKSVHQHAVLYMPENFEELFEKFANKLSGRQKASRKVVKSNHPEVSMIRDMVLRSNRFLEQEILSDD